GGGLDEPAGVALRHAARPRVDRAAPLGGRGPGRALRELPPRGGLRRVPRRTGAAAPRAPGRLPLDAPGAGAPRRAALRELPPGLALLHRVPRAARALADRRARRARGAALPPALGRVAARPGAARARRAPRDERPRDAPRGAGLRRVPPRARP